MPISSIVTVYPDNLIPDWKNPIENGVPEILVSSGGPPPLSGGPVDELVDFHCAETFDRDGGIIDQEKVLGTIFDDQT